MALGPQLSVVTAAAVDLRDRVRGLADEVDSTGATRDDLVAALAEAERSLDVAVRRLEQVAVRLR